MNDLLKSAKVVADTMGILKVREGFPIVGKPPKQRRARRAPTLVTVAKQASKAGLEVKQYEVRPDGSVVVVTGAPDATDTNVNPWDEVLSHERH
jgi:hypothetical protein